MTDRVLYLSQDRTPPDLTSLDVKHRERVTAGGRTVDVTVIGSSHYVAVPDLSFHELLSCRAVADPDATAPLRRGHAAWVDHESETVAATTLLRAEPLAAFPGPAATDVAYRFGPDAYTAVTVLGPRRYETYHTYPEYDLSLYTATAFVDRSAAAATDRGVDALSSPPAERSGSD